MKLTMVPEPQPTQPETYEQLIRRLRRVAGKQKWRLVQHDPFSGSWALYDDDIVCSGNGDALNNNPDGILRSIEVFLDKVAGLKSR